MANIKSAMGSGVDQLELLRKRNQDLKDQIKEMKHSQMRQAYQRKVSIVDTRRLELVFNYVPSVPWSIFWHFSCRGGEHTIQYFLILRDWAWFASSYDLCYSMGAICCAWAGFQTLHAIWQKNMRECFFSISRLLWLTATYIWATGAVHDTALPAQQPIAVINRYEAQQALIAAMAIEIFFIICIRPLFPSNAHHTIVTPVSAPFPDSLESLTSYDEPRLKYTTWHFRCCWWLRFDTFREYETVQVLFWIGRDLGAAANHPIMWAIFTLMSFVANLFLVNTALNTRRVIIDYAHYLSQSVWLTGTFVYQLGFMFFVGDQNFNHFQYLYPRKMDSLEMCTYYGTWTVIFAYVPLALLFALWWSLTLAGIVTGKPLIVDDYKELTFLEAYEEVESDVVLGAPEKPDEQVVKRVVVNKAQHTPAVSFEGRNPMVKELVKPTPSAKAALKKKKPVLVSPLEEKADVDDTPLSPMELELSWIGVELGESHAQI